ncbi:hypothetical protein D9619_000065 [Psilocybe cf. subviscida]|uniref:F-box domain-containing protein n=1 Tax=Psilocybe cf. subviscida TaxID=2480587 RepID=A0A8H5BH42_9AGAR|nr:hypothetical protein D9619_000065 [Psilocybe cf. subviscida]
MRTRSSKCRMVDGDRELIAPETLEELRKSHDSRQRKTPGRKKAKASRLPCPNTLGAMPLDILLEIFKPLHPGDLVSLALSSKVLLTALRMDHAKAVWKKARESVALPEPLEGMTEMQFAWLIFNSWCTVCASESNATIDFMLRRRLCTKCRKRNLVKTSEFKEAFPKLDQSILSMLVPTHGPSAGGYQYFYYWWKADIERMAKKLEALEARTASENATGALVNFKEAQQEVATKMLDDAVDLTEAYNSWLYHERERDRDEAERAERKRTQKCHNLYVLDTTHAISNWNGYGIRKTPNPHAREVWADTRKALEPWIQEAASARREREDKLVRDARRRIFEGLYQEYHLTVDPSRWRYMPSAGTLRELAIFRNLIELPASHVVAEDSFAEAMANLDTMIATIIDKRKSDMLERLSFVAFTEGVPKAVNRASSLHLLECAILANRCGSCNQAVFGWEELSSHRCCATTEPAFYPDSLFTQAAVKVVRAARLPLQPDTSVAQIDTVDTIYVCASCTPINRHSRKAATAYRWRDCAKHLPARHESLWKQ